MEQRNLHMVKLCHGFERLVVAGEQTQLVHDKNNIVCTCEVKMRTNRIFPRKQETISIKYCLHYILEMVYEPI